MSVYKFKSSGRTASLNQIEALQVTTLPVGIKTPLSIGDRDLFAMHYNNEDQLHDNLRNLILTNWGERLGIYEFGANLKELTSEFTDIDSFDEQAITRIKNTVSRWMPFISLRNFASSINREENRSVGILKILITYDIPRLGIQNKSLQISMYVT